MNDGEQYNVCTIYKMLQQTVKNRFSKMDFQDFTGNYFGPYTVPCTLSKIQDLS